jgi:hypothetical protein
LNRTYEYSIHSIQDSFKKFEKFNFNCQPYDRLQTILIEAVDFHALFCWCDKAGGPCVSESTRAQPALSFGAQATENSLSLKTAPSHISCKIFCIPPLEMQNLLKSKTKESESAGAVDAILYLVVSNAKIFWIFDSLVSISTSSIKFTHVHVPHENVIYIRAKSVAAITVAVSSQRKDHRLGTSVLFLSDKNKSDSIERTFRISCA